MTPKLSGALILAALAICASVAPSASATQPKIVPETGTYPVHLASNEAFKTTELQSAAGSLKGEGFKLKLTATAASTGTYTMTFEHVRKVTGGEVACQSGEQSGQVVIENNKFDLFHDVEAEILKVKVFEGIGVLFTVSPEITVHCGTTLVKVVGTSLGLLGNTVFFATETNGTLHCKAGSTGEPEETSYWDGSNIAHTALLQANFGTGLKKACESLGSEASIKIESEAMRKFKVEE